MSDILVTMDDGSQYLVHHGVLGMKWGVRNEETLRKYAGMKGAGSVKTKYKRDRRIQKLETKQQKTSSQKKKDRFEKKKEYLKELNDPGSGRVSTKILKKKRLKNYLGAGAGTYISLSGAVNALSGLTIAAAAPMYAPAGAAVLAGLGMGYVFGGTIRTAVGAKIAKDSIDRASTITGSIKNRENQADSVKSSKKRR